MIFFSISCSFLEEICQPNFARLSVLSSAGFGELDHPGSRRKVPKGVEEGEEEDHEDAEDLEPNFEGGAEDAFYHRLTPLSVPKA